MSTHTFALGANPGSAATAVLVECMAQSIPVVGVSLAGSTVSLTCTPDLSPADQATLGDIVATCSAREPSITLAEYQAIKSDLAALRTFVGVATPTAAQTAAATKSIVRVLAALLRS